VLVLVMELQEAEELANTTLHWTHNFYIDTRMGLSPTRFYNDLDRHFWARASRVGISHRRAYPESVPMDSDHRDSKQV
jgi:hypothetical protein